MNPLLISTFAALGVYFGAARLAQSAASTSSNQSAGLNAALKNNRKAAMQLCAY